MKIVAHLPSLNAEEQHLVAALLVQHVNSVGPSGENNPLYRLAQRVCDHLDERGLLAAVEPLPIKSTPNHPYGGRLMMHWTEPAPKAEPESTPVNP